MSYSYIAIDTNILLRFILQHDNPQTSTVNSLFQEATTLVIPDQALIEVCFVLSRHYGYSRKGVATVLGAVTSLQHVVCEYDVLENSLGLWMKFPKLSFEDCWMVYSCEKKGIELLTLDKKLANQAPSAKLLV